MPRKNRAGPTIRPWESPNHRFWAPFDLRHELGNNNSTIAVPLNTITHIQSDHPKDVQILDQLQEFIDAYEWTEYKEWTDPKVVVYSRHDGIWRRGIIVKAESETDPNILISIYRRDEAKVLRAIRQGRLKQRGE